MMKKAVLARHTFLDAGDGGAGAHWQHALTWELPEIDVTPSQRYTDTSGFTSQTEDTVEVRLLPSAPTSVYCRLLLLPSAPTAVCSYFRLLLLPSAPTSACSSFVCASANNARACASACVHPSPQRWLLDSVLVA